MIEKDQGSYDMNTETGWCVGGRGGGGRGLVMV